MFLTRSIPTVMGAGPILRADTKSLAFGGTDEYVSMMVGQTDGWSAITVSAWFKTSIGNSATGAILAPYGNASAYPFWIAVNNQKLESAINAHRALSGGSTRLASSANVNDGEWHHGLFTWDTSTDKHILYLDGEEVDSETNDGNNYAAYSGVLRSTATVNAIGFMGYYSGGLASQRNSPFIGNINEVAIWDKALTANEIKDIYKYKRLDFLNNSVGYRSKDNLQGWWKMGDGKLDAFSNSNQTGIGFITNEANYAIKETLVPNMSDNGNYTGAGDSNWKVSNVDGGMGSAADLEWDINTNTSTSFEATVNSDIVGTAACQFYMTSTNSAFSNHMGTSSVKITGTLETTGTLPNTQSQLNLWNNFGGTNSHTISAGDFVIYDSIINSSNHHFQFLTSTVGHNFKLSNLKIEKWDNPTGYASKTYMGVTHNMEASDLESDVH